MKNARELDRIYNISMPQRCIKFSQFEFELITAKLLKITYKRGVLFDVLIPECT